mgnify:CR=1 FL=1
MEINFFVDPKSIKYFSNRTNINKANPKILQDAKKTKDIISKLRKTHVKTINTLFNGFFCNKWIDETKISVKVFPEYFELWAVNIKDKTILLWQKQRSKYFYLWLLVHEVWHIYIHEKSKNKLVNEIIAMLLEAHIYDILEAKMIDDIRNNKELDAFHKIAMKYTLKFYKKFKDTIKKWESVNKFLPFLIKSIPIKYRDIEPPKWLLANLHIQKKYYLASWCLARKEHFGTLILLPHGKRFSVDNYFFKVIKQLQGKTIDELVRITKWDTKRIHDFVIDCQKKWIISSDKPKILPRIIENKYISHDCLTFPRTIYVECTRKCNYKCIHCYSSSWWTSNTKEMPFSVIKKLINEISKHGAEFFNIWWGEPLLYKDIYKTIAYANQKHIPTEITTNWYFINDITIKNLKKSWLTFIQVSLDWANQKTYGTIRPWWDIERIKKNIKKLIKNKFVVSICTVVNKINYHEIFDIIELCKKLWVQYYRVLPCIEVGRWAAMSSLQINKDEFQTLYKKIIHLSHTDLAWLKISFNENLVIPNRKNITRMPENHYWCSAGRTTCWIDVQGNVYPCSYMLFDSLWCGNIQKESLMNIRKTSKVMKDIRHIEKIEGKCSNCSFLKLCRWWCRAAAYAKYNSLEAEDPLCSII